MSTAAAFAAAHTDLIAVMGDPVVYAPTSGGSVLLQAVLDRHTADVGDYGQTVAYRPSIAVLNTDVPHPATGDIVTFADPITDVVSSTWRVVRIASADEYVTVLWVEESP